MKTNSLDIQNFIDDPEASESEMLLRFFRFQGNRENTLNLEQIPAIIRAGCVVLCLKGEFDIKLNERTYTVRERGLCIILPDTVVQGMRRSEDMDCIVLAGELEFVRELPAVPASNLFLTISRNPCISLTEEEKIIILAHFEYIRLNYERKNFPYRLDVTRQLLLVFSHEIAAIYQNGKRTKKKIDSYQEKIFHDFIHLVSENYMRERRVVFYAQKLCLTAKHLSHIVKKTSRKTASQWIDGYIIRNAKLMLLSSPLTVQQISDRLNFPNPSFFTQYFKRKTGKTPKEFRMTVK